MSDPDIRIVIEGLQRWERDIDRLLRRREVVDRTNDETLRALEGIARQLQDLEKRLGGKP